VPKEKKDKQDKHGKGLHLNKRQKKNYKEFQKGFKTPFGILKKKVLSIAAVLCIWLCCSGDIFAALDGSLKLKWNPVTTNVGGSKCDNLAGYRLYVGNASGVYDTVYDVKNVTEYEIKNLEVGIKYFIAVTAYNTYNRESGKSNEVHSGGKYYFVPSQVMGLIEITAENVNIYTETVNITKEGM
jgi:hypothetical protein